MILETEPDHALLWVSGRVPTDLDKTKLSLYRVHTAPALNQQPTVIKRTSLSDFSKCLSNSSPRLMGKPTMAQRSLKNSGKLFQTPKSERALLVAMSLSQFISNQMTLQCLLLSQPLPTKTNWPTVAKQTYRKLCKIKPPLKFHTSKHLLHLTESLHLQIPASDL